MNERIDQAEKCWMTYENKRRNYEHTMLKISWVMITLNLNKLNIIFMVPAKNFLVLGSY